MLHVLGFLLAVDFMLQSKIIDFSVCGLHHALVFIHGCFIFVCGPVLLPLLHCQVEAWIINKCNCKVHVYSPDIPVGSADCTMYTPGIGTHSFIVSSPLGRIQHLLAVLQL